MGRRARPVRAPGQPAPAAAGDSRRPARASRSRGVAEWAAAGAGATSGPEDIDGVRERIRQQLRNQELDVELNEALAQELAGYNDRDTELTQRRLDDIGEALAGDAIDIDRLLFGGSVAKHTYVDGLSDVDALVVLDDPDSGPGELVERFAQALSGQLPPGDVLAVEPGGLAVTVTYRDGSQVQLLPAVERDGRTSIASEDSRGWRTIRPHKFAEKLTQVNNANGGAVVPTIKLGKAALAGLPEAQRLSGYHVEAIAVDAFKGYAGRRDRMSMLLHLIDHTAEAVMRPTGDITGQSLHIDTHLGPARSATRETAQQELRRLHARLKSAASAADLRRLLHE